MSGLLSPRIGDSLAGRIERVPLRPFTQAEIERRPVPGWLDTLWQGFVAGLVLCTARQTIPLGRRLWAVPIEALWS